MKQLFHQPSFRELMQKKTIFKIDQLQKLDKDEPRSIFTPHYKLGDLDTYYRRGDTKAYTGNFIPVWLYPIFLDKVIIYLPPYSKEKDIFNYCGATLSQVLELVKADLIVPLIGNDLESYQEEVFGVFIRKLPENKPLIRAQLFEDILLGGDFGFREKVTKIAKNYGERLEKADAQLWEEYEEGRKKNPLIVAHERLPNFVGERVEWQKLFGLNENVSYIEEALSESPLAAYRTARTLHYIVVPKAYSRGGFTMMAYNDDLQFGEDERGKKASILFPQGSGEVITTGERVEARIIQIPMQDWEVEQAVDLVIWIREQDKKAKEPGQKITGEISNVMERLWNTYESQREPLRRYKEDTELLNDAFRGFSQRARDALAKKAAWDERKHILSAGLTSLPAALHEGNCKALYESLEQLSGLITSPIKGILSMAIRAGFVREDEPEILKKVVEQLRKLEGIIQLWGEKEGMNTPFMLVGYHNPIK